MTQDQDTVWVEDRIEFTLIELSTICRVDATQLVALVEEGVLEVRGSEPTCWRFDGKNLGRARAALRLARDFELSPAGTALALDLLEQIKALRAQLRQFGVR